MKALGFATNQLTTLLNINKKTLIYTVRKCTRLIQVIDRYEPDKY